MRTLSRFGGALAVALLGLGVATSAHAQLNFGFEFDGTLDNTLIPPIVGTGSFTLGADPGDGTFAWNVLNSPTASFTVSGVTFTNANITGDLNLVRAVISTSGSQRRIQFSDTGAGSGGSANGSLDFNNGGNILTFEPSYNGTGLNLYLINQGNGFVGGTYRGLTAAAVVPEPGEWAVLGMGALGVGGLMVRARRRKTSAA